MYMYSVYCIVTLGAHSKIVSSSLLTANKLKKRIEKEKLKRQRGSKSVGAEATTRAFQQTRAQNPDFDVFSADAVELSRPFTI